MRPDLRRGAGGAPPGRTKAFLALEPFGNMAVPSAHGKKGRSFQAGGVRACVGDWGLPCPRQGAVARPPRLPLLLGGGDTDQGTPTRFVAICCCFVHKLEAASELSRFRKCLSRTRLSHRTAQRRLSAGAGAQAAGAGRDAGPRAEAPRSPEPGGPQGPPPAAAVSLPPARPGGTQGKGHGCPVSLGAQPRRSLQPPDPADEHPPTQTR